MRWTVTPSEAKDSDSNDSRKNIYYLYVLTCSVDSFEFFSPSVVVVGFIGTMKSN